MVWSDLNQKTHQFQFSVWKRSMKYRFFIESFFTLCLTLFFQYYISKFTKYLYLASDDYYTLRNDPNHSEDLEEILFTEMDEAVEELKKALLVSSIQLLLPFNILIQHLIIGKTMRYSPQFNFYNLVDIFLFLLRECSST